MFPGRRASLQINFLSFLTSILKSLATHLFAVWQLQYQSSLMSFAPRFADALSQLGKQPHHTHFTGEETEPGASWVLASNSQDKSMADRKPRCFCLFGLQTPDLITSLFSKASHWSHPSGKQDEFPWVDLNALAGTSVQNFPGCSHYSKEKTRGISTKPRMKRKAIYSQLSRSLKNKKPKPAAETNQQPMVLGA